MIKLLVVNVYSLHKIGLRSALWISTNNLIQYLDLYIYLFKIKETQESLLSSENYFHLFKRLYE